MIALLTTYNQQASQENTTTNSGNNSHINHQLHYSITPFLERKDLLDHNNSDIAEQAKQAIIHLLDSRAFDHQLSSNWTNTPFLYKDHPDANVQSAYKRAKVRTLTSNISISDLRQLDSQLKDVDNDIKAQVNEKLQQVIELSDAHISVGIIA